ncbi:hypothetical protein BCY86_05565 [Pajaroellobacter abortibovis]|uniref:NADH:quinone oxidoreductase/Mrp antiporter transmembrane domain-containing protein n=1 Tax=Pajaroellobacter abortibovis TaxID=1882918 RepID=A0A1L6MZS8_9BACT|nr:hypothetical protein BCY86_05565 [Pajaroellobacter abortibovis]
MQTYPLLSWLIGIPIGCAFLLLFLPRQALRTLQTLTCFVTLFVFTISLLLLKVPMGKEFHWVQKIHWIESFGISYHVGLDGISLWLVLLTTFLFPIAAYSSFGSIHTRQKEWCFSLLLLEGALVGAFVALDLFLFYVFWELVLIPMIFMIGIWGSTKRIYASIKFFIYTMFGSVLMLGAIIYLAYSYSIATQGSLSFDYFELQRVLIPYSIERWLYTAFTLSFLIKVPMWPVHTWLPDAHTEAPTVGSILLAAILLKLGTYGYLRFSIGLFPEASTELAPYLAGIAVVGGILYGALCAWKQEDVKRLVAYSSVAHLGYIMLGLFAATPSSVEGAVLQMINHGISTGFLFLLIGMLYDRRHTRQLSEFGGLAKSMPVYTTFFVIATMASIGLPGMNGFVGEFMIIVGTFASHTLGQLGGLQAVGATAGVILAAVYMLNPVERMFFGSASRVENKYLPDLSGHELTTAFPFLVMIFTLGLFPHIFLSEIRGAVTRIQQETQIRLTRYPGLGYYEGPVQLLPKKVEPSAQPSYIPWKPSK